MEWEEYFSEYVVDGNATQTPWIAGSDPPQWWKSTCRTNITSKPFKSFWRLVLDDLFFYTHEIQLKRDSSANYETIHTFADERVNFETLSYEREFLTITKPGVFDHTGQISIFDLSGNKIQLINPAGFDQKIDISGLLPGLYILRIQNQSNVTIVKFIKPF